MKDIFDTSDVSDLPESLQAELPNYTNPRGAGEEKMSESKHTPGPWRAAGGGRSVGVYSHFEDNTPISAPVHIASCWNSPSCDGYANARLIAAAPDLLEALELLCDELGVSMPDETQEFNAENIWRAVAQAQTAIARATTHQEDPDT